MKKTQEEEEDEVNSSMVIVDWMMELLKRGT